jgi:polysaccharide export outer membrane protein
LLALVVLGVCGSSTGCQIAALKTAQAMKDSPGPTAELLKARGQMPGPAELPPTTFVSDLGPITTNQAQKPPATKALREVDLPRPERGTDCQAAFQGAYRHSVPTVGVIPTELDRRSLPPYTIAPPDILIIDAVRLVPRPPYKIEPLETLVINVSDTLPNQPITGQFVVSPEGTVNLGFAYGNVKVAGLTMDQTQEAIRTHLGKILRNPPVTVVLPQYRGLQMIRGEHLVRPDGTVHLGVYGTGSVYVAGMTLAQAKHAIEKHLSEFLVNPQLSLDVLAYNSKVYFVIFDGGGMGQQVFRLPITGNETVLDAIAQVQGLAPVSSKKHIWVARPSPACNECNQILPVDWDAITQAGSTATNYQLFPGDRVYVKADCLSRLDIGLAKLLAPVERILGVTFLGSNTVQSIINPNFNRGFVVSP